MYAPRWVLVHHAAPECWTQFDRPLYIWHASSVHYTAVISTFTCLVIRNAELMLHHAKKLIAVKELEATKIFQHNWCRHDAIHDGNSWQTAQRDRKCPSQRRSFFTSASVVRAPSPKREMSIAVSLFDHHYFVVFVSFYGGKPIVTLRNSVCKIPDTHMGKTILMASAAAIIWYRHISTSVERCQREREREREYSRRTCCRAQRHLVCFAQSTLQTPESTVLCTDHIVLPSSNMTNHHGRQPRTKHLPAQPFLQHTVSYNPSSALIHLLHRSTETLKNYSIKFVN